jgi:hypothetical protein
MLPENRAYKYDFFFDNCATKIRDIFTNCLGDSFEYANVLNLEKKITFRQIINKYLAQNQWERLGINILLGKSIDKKITNQEIMFLPDYLQASFLKSSIGNKNISGNKTRILDEVKTIGPNPINVTIIFIGLFLITLLISFFPKLNILNNLIQNFWLIVSGLLGILILTMWFATDHQACSQNFNLLWALPTNLFFIFRKKQFKYAIIGIVLILTSFILHFTGIQQLLLPEMAPILLSILIVFWGILKNGRKKANING